MNSKKNREISNAIRALMNSQEDILEDKSDLSDFGNIIGLAIGEHIDDEMGYELEDFISGLRHGISLKDGTH